MKHLAISLHIALSPFAVSLAQAQEGILRLDEIRQPEQRRIIRIPDVNGFQVLKCDFHLHTVFTDGHVWPNVRVQEAWREGLDSFSFDRSHVRRQGARCSRTLHEPSSERFGPLR